VLTPSWFNLRVWFRRGQRRVSCVRGYTVSNLFGVYGMAYCGCLWWLNVSRASGEKDHLQ
jgi:hypothetical protein